MELPARSTLDRLTRSASATGEAAIWQRLSTRLPSAFGVAVDALLNAPDDARRSLLFQLEQYPSNAKPPAIRRYLERSTLLQVLSVGKRYVAGTQTVG